METSNKNDPGSRPSMQKPNRRIAFFEILLTILLVLIFSLTAILIGIYTNQSLKDNRLDLDPRNKINVAVLAYSGSKYFPKFLSDKLEGGLSERYNIKKDRDKKLISYSKKSDNGQAVHFKFAKDRDLVMFLLFILGMVLTTHSFVYKHYPFSSIELRGKKFLLSIASLLISVSTFSVFSNIYGEKLRIIEKEIEKPIQCPEVEAICNSVFTTINNFKAGEYQLNLQQQNVKLKQNKRSHKEQRDHKEQLDNVIKMIEKFYENNKWQPNAILIEGYADTMPIAEQKRLKSIGFDIDKRIRECQNPADIPEKYNSNIELAYLRAYSVMYYLQKILENGKLKDKIKYYFISSFSQNKSLMQKKFENICCPYVEQVNPDDRRAVVTLSKCPPNDINSDEEQVNDKERRVVVRLLRIDPEGSNGTDQFSVPSHEVQQQSSQRPDQ